MRRRRRVAMPAAVAVVIATAIGACATGGAGRTRGVAAPAAVAEPAVIIRGAGDDVTAPPGARASGDAAALAYAGHDAAGRPRYVQRTFDDAERALLRDAFGIADPNRLWLPDSSDTAELRYDALSGGLTARVGYRSWRRAGETWEAFVDRIARMDRRAWPAAARGSYHTGLAALDPQARPAFEALVAAARAAGFRVRVLETYRAPERQAYLLAHGNGKTQTPTSAHLYGRAADIVVGDGRITRRATANEWIAFRRWVLAWGGGRFRLVGTPTRTWDWPHVELVDPPLGFRSVDALLAAARACVAAPRSDGDPCVVDARRAGGVAER